MWVFGCSSELVELLVILQTLVHNSGFFINVHMSVTTHTRVMQLVCDGGRGHIPALNWEWWNSLRKKWVRRVENPGKFSCKTIRPTCWEPIWVVLLFGPSGSDIGCNFSLNYFISLFRISRDGSPMPRSPKVEKVCALYFLCWSAKHKISFFSAEHREICLVEKIKQELMNRNPI